MNYAAYMPEIFRSGIQAIPKGQWEAGAAMGMSRRKLMRRIILPQATRIIIPSLGNNFVSIFKDSALVSILTMRDLMFSGQLLASATFKHFEIYTMVAVIYLAISYPGGAAGGMDRTKHGDRAAAGSCGPPAELSCGGCGRRGRDGLGVRQPNGIASYWVTASSSAGTGTARRSKVGTAASSARVIGFARCAKHLFWRADFHDPPMAA